MDKESSNTEEDAAKRTVVWVEVAVNIKGTPLDWPTTTHHESATVDASHARVVVETAVATLSPLYTLNVRASLFNPDAYTPNAYEIPAMVGMVWSRRPELSNEALCSPEKAVVELSMTAVLELLQPDQPAIDVPPATEGWSNPEFTTCSSRSSAVKMILVVPSDL